MVLNGKYSQGDPVNAVVPQHSILHSTLFPIYIKDLSDDCICNILIYADDATLSSKCDQASDLWQQLKLASELESDLQDTVDQGKKWLLDVNARKTHLVLFDQFNNTGVIDVKMVGSVLEQKSSFKIPELSFSSIFDWGSHIFSNAQNSSNKFGALICFMTFFSPEVALYLYKSNI